MLKFAQLRGAIFDVDDTLLDNQPASEALGLHEQSRLKAAHIVGKRHGVAALQAFTPEQSTLAFRDAKVHSLQGAVWQMLFIAKQVDSRDINPAHPLLLEIMTLKDELHEEVLRSKGAEVPGAGAFVRAFAMNGLGDRLAIASTAYRRDVDIALEIIGLTDLFPNDTIITREQFTHAKPHPEPFNLAYGLLGLPDSDRQYVAAFEDDHRGVLSAQAAGLFTCAITTRVDRQTFEAMDTPPDLIADSYDEFESLLGLQSNQHTL